MSFLVLARWGEGAQCSGSRCQLAQAAGSEAKEGTEPAAPGHTATLQDTLRALTGAHNDIHGERGSQGHTHRCAIQHTAKAQKYEDARQRVTCRYQEIMHTQADKYLLRHTPKQSQAQAGHFSRGKPRAVSTQTDTNRHTPSGMGRHTGSKIADTITGTQMYKGPGTLGHTWSITPRATAVQDREANEHRQANLKDSQRPEAQQAHRGTRPGPGGTSSGTPPLGARSGAPGDTPTGGGSGEQRGPSAPGAHGSPPGAPSVRARACVPGRARRHLWEERCALRPGLPGWRGAGRGGAVAMVRGARPHTNGAATGAAPLPARLLPPTPSVPPESPRPVAPAGDPPTQRAGAPGGCQEARIPGPSRPRLPRRRPRPVRSGARAERGPGALQGLPGLGAGTKRARQLGAQVLPWNGGGYPGRVGNKGGT